MTLNPLTLLREANKKVPALKYAFGVVGIAATIAIIKGLNISNASIPIGTILLVLGLMVLVFIFSVLVRSKDRSVQKAGIILLYSVVLFAVLSGGLLISSIFFDFPKPIEKIKLVNNSKQDLVEKKNSITLADSIRQELSKRKQWISSMLTRNVYRDEIKTLEAVFKGDSGSNADSTVSDFFVYEKFRQNSCDKLLSDLELQTDTSLVSTKDAFKEAWLKYYLNPPNEQFDSTRQRYFERLPDQDILDFQQRIYPRMKF